MKKYVRILAFVLCAIISLMAFASCSDKKDEDSKPRLFDYVGKDLSKYIELATYKERTLEINKIEITDADVDAKVKALLKENNVCTKITDRAAVKGDTVVVDYTGYMNGEAFSGGSATNVTLELIDNSGYIDGFAEGVIGHTPGEEFTVPVRFPDNYGKVDYAGKDAEFVFKLYHIVKYEVTDEFAIEYSGGKCESADGFSAYIREELYKAKYDDAVYNAIWEAVKSESKVISYPKSSLDYYYSALRAQCENIAAQLGTTYENALAYMGVTEQTLIEYAESYTKDDLVMYQVAKKENCLPTDADIDSFSLHYAKNNLSTLKNEMLADGYKLEDVNEQSAAKYAKENHSDYMRLECLRVKFSAFLVSNNTFTEK